MKKALESLDGVADIDLDTSKTCGSFTAPADMDIEAELNKLVEGGASKMKGWSKAE